MSAEKPNKLPPSRERPILFGFAVQTRNTDGRFQIALRWKRILITGVTLLVTAWISVASILFFYFKYNMEFSEVSYSGMILLPFRISEHRKELGDYHTKKGLEELKDQNYRDALRLLRLGVGRSPSNLEGRKALAELYEYALKRPDVAAEMLLQGIPKGGAEDNDYLSTTLRFLIRNQMDARIQELADEYLPATPEINERNNILAFSAANANYLRGNYDRADDYLLHYELLDTLDGILLSSQISWDRGNKVAAITKLEASQRRYPDSEPLLVQLSRYHREAGNLEEARRYAILRNIKSPLSAGPRIELLYNYEASGDTDRVKEESANLLKQFSDDQAALQALANFAADSGDVEIARRTYEEALEREFDIDSFALLLVEAHLVSRDFQGALNFAEELIKERPDWLEERMSIFNSLRSVASFGISRPDLGEIYLKKFISEANNQAGTYLAVARRFNSVDRPEQARKVLFAAYENLPLNQKVLTELIRVELELGNTDYLSSLLTRLLQMRRPQMDLLLEAYLKIGSDRFIFADNREGMLLQLSAILRENSATSDKI